jgi:hypothetical protein
LGGRVMPPGIAPQGLDLDHVGAEVAGIARRSAATKLVTSTTRTSPERCLRLDPLCCFVDVPLLPATGCPDTPSSPGRERTGRRRQFA